MRDTGEMERAIAALASGIFSGLIVTASALTVFHRDLIVTPSRPGTSCPRSMSSASLSPSGGLISYGANVVDRCPARRKLHFDRILKGEKPADFR